MGVNSFPGQKEAGKSVRFLLDNQGRIFLSMMDY